MKIKHALTLAILLAIPGREALACAACGCLLSKDWVGQEDITHSGWAVGLSYDFINQNRMRLGNSNLSYPAALNAVGGTGNEVETATATRITTASISYNSGNWGWDAQLPYYDRYHTTMQTGDGGYNYSQSNELGDMRVMGKYNGIFADGSTGILFGVKLATGTTNTSFAYGGLVDAALQVGTGSNDLILGAYHIGSIGKLGWFAQATYQFAISTTGGYRPGDTTNVNLGLRYAKFGQKVTPLFQINYIHRQSDSGPAASYYTGGPYIGTPITGGDLAYLAPGASIRLGDGYAVYGYVQFPAYQNVVGVQLVAPRIYSLGIRKIF